MQSTIACIPCETINNIPDAEAVALVTTNSCRDVQELPQIFENILKLSLFALGGAAETLNGFISSITYAVNSSDPHSLLAANAIRLPGILNKIETQFNEKIILIFDFNEKMQIS